MVGRHPGHTTSQGQILSDLFVQAGYPVVMASDRLNRYSRLGDIVRTLIRQRDNIDILVVEVYGGPSFVVEDIASALGRSFGQRVILWLHGGAMPTFMARYRRWTRQVLKRAELLVVPSTYLARAVATHGFGARVIPNVIDLPEYIYRQRRSLHPRLLWMRSFHPIYNPELALRALARLRRSVPAATLVMAGTDGGCEAHVRNLAAQLGLGDAVSFTGFLDMAQKVRIGQDSDIFLNTSRVDNMPVCLVEAGAMGLPIVSTSVGGVPDLMTDRQTALLVPDDDDEGVVQAVEHLLTNPDLAETLSRNGRRLAERSSWNEVRPQWEQVFLEVTERYGLKGQLVSGQCAASAA